MITLNTLIKETEFDDALKLAFKAVEDDVDAIIVQDLGIIHMFKSKLPMIEVHAGTQMTISNQYGIDLLDQINVKRVILARELNQEEIHELSLYAAEKKEDRY